MDCQDGSRRDFAPDLVDGIAAYSHFLSGNGQRRDVQYWRFLMNDSSGQKVLASALEDTRHDALQRHDQDQWIIYGTEYPVDAFGNIFWKQGWTLGLSSGLLVSLMSD